MFNIIHFIIITACMVKSVIIIFNIVLYYTFHVDGVNSFVLVTFIGSSKRVHCQFLRSLPRDSVKQCTANVSYGSNCDQFLGMYTNMSNSNFVITPPLELIDSVLEYCLSVAAIHNNDTVIVEGTINLFNTGKTINYYYYYYTTKI